MCHVKISVDRDDLRLPNNFSSSLLSSLTDYINWHRSGLNQYILLTQMALHT